MRYRLLACIGPGAPFCCVDSDETGVAHAPERRQRAAAFAPGIEPLK